MKQDKDKDRWDLIPWPELREVVAVFTQGAQKYEPRGWQKVERQRYFAALMRHVAACACGERTDIGSGKSHWAHVAANALILLWHDRNDAE
jgi:hypothetical protein